MANHYYGVNLGAGFDPANVSTGTSTTSKSVELVIVDATTGIAGDKMQVLRAIDAIKEKIIQGNAPS